MRNFIYNSLPARVLFGQGRIADLGPELERLGVSRVMAISTPGRADMADRVADLAGGRCVASFTGAVMHTPIEVTEAAMQVVQEQGIDGLVAIGGGSTIGLAKAIALRTDLPQLVIPTTYAGSEMTSVVGQTSNGTKVTQASPKVLPEVVIYDFDLTMTLPPRSSGTSGINAIAHAVEALYVRDRNPIISLMAAEGIRVLLAALPVIARDPQDLEAREQAQYGAWLCGTCLGAVGAALHHKLAHTLGGSFNLPHAETHAVVLPHALAYNAPAIPEAMAVLQQATGSQDPALALYKLAEAVGAPLGLRDLGMAEDDVSQAVRIAMANPYWNPRPLEARPLHETLLRAWSGEPPRIP